MTGARTIGDLIARGRAEGLVGRERELALLEGLAAACGPAVVYLHGPYGIGKTALLDAALAGLGRSGIACIRIDGRSVEPQPRAVVAAFSAAIGSACEAPAALAGAIAGLDRPAVLAIDDADSLRLVATWLLREFAPALPATARLIIAGRLPPPATWIAEYGDLFLAIPLGPLADEAVEARATALGLDDRTVQWVRDVSAGHPLGVSMALQVARAGLFEASGTPGALVEALLAGSGDPVLRRIAEAAAVVRRVTRPLLAAMVGEVADESFDAFSVLPFVSIDDEGCRLAEPARRALGARLSALEPDRHAALRLKAATWITEHLAAAAASGRWRYMADLLHLVEHPQIRDAFFPPEAVLPSVEPARRQDFTAMFAIAEARVGAAERHIIEHWARALPHRFNVARGPGEEVLAFYVYARDDDELDDLSAVDPLLADWRTHLAQNHVTGGTIFMRALLAADPAESALERAACILDLKRAYFERWDLSRVYAAASAAASEGPVMRRLGFRPLSAPRDGLPGAIVLDLGGAGLIGWITALVGVPTMPQKAAPDLDFARDRREIAIGGNIVRLTRLETDVLAMLIDRAPAVVTREALIETVWRRAFVGSNVVDAVVRTLRRKLGPERARIAAVPKAGYRFVARDIATPSGSRRSP